MNIYFSGIGGVGVGSLAELAQDAGHRIVGSDRSESLTTQELRKRGVTISFDQTGDFLRQTHEQTPIDWVVYTAALPSDHPELIAAQQLGLKTTKMNALLRAIITEKNLKLIAVAGTHGKTTTTAMTVWAMQQLDIPVSYLVGSTLSFGPSAHYEPGSEYFVYECDEFDRNFLHFHPYLSLITSVDYDHPDIYQTPADYQAAFRQFIEQSDFTIMWQKDAAGLGTLPSAWVLENKDVYDLTLAGIHNRQNASLVIKAFEKLGISGDVRHVLGSYPGASRRFEQLANNLYTDYGHHPAEIKATLQLAHELNDDVVLVYQPHQNVRQHEIKDEYTDAVFKDAHDIYWLPTYLTREDSTLPVLTPPELAGHITNHAALHFADLDDELWDAVQAARDRGALVVFMGAGNIDNWVREKLGG